MVIKVNFGGNYSPDYIYVPNEISLKNMKLETNFIFGLTIQKMSILFGVMKMESKLDSIIGVMR